MPSCSSSMASSSWIVESGMDYGRLRGSASGTQPSSHVGGTALGKNRTVASPNLLTAGASAFHCAALKLLSEERS